MAKLVIDDEVKHAWDRITADAATISWAAFGYPADTTNKLVLKGEGTGGMPEFIASLPEDDVMWGAFKVVGCDDRGNLVSRRPKYIFVKWMPASGVSGMKKAKTAGHKGDLKKIINSHVDIEVDCKGDLTEEVVIAKLRASGGAHQPTRYEFSDYSS